MVAPGAIADGSFCWTWEPLELWNQLLTYICLHVYIWNTYFFYSILGIRLYIHGVFVPERDLSPSCSKRCHSSASELRIHSDRLTRTDGTWTIGAIWCNTSTIGESCANGHIKNCPLFKIFKKCSGARFEKKNGTPSTQLDGKPTSTDTKNHKQGTHLVPKLRSTSQTNPPQVARGYLSPKLWHKRWNSRCSCLPLETLFMAAACENMGCLASR